MKTSLVTHRAYGLVQYVEPFQDDGHLDQPEVCLLKAAYFFDSSPVVVGPQRVKARATGYDSVMISTVMSASSRRIIP